MTSSKIATGKPPGCFSNKLAPERLAKVLAAGLILLTACLATAFIFSGKSQSPDTLDTPIAPTIELRNLHQVHSYLFRGGFPSMDGLKRLKSMGVKTIIDLRASPDSIKLETMECQVLGLNYVSLPTKTYHLPSPKQQQVFFQLVQAASESSKAGKVFVHCSHGSDRTGFLIALWRVKHDHWSYAAAFSEMLKYGFLIHQIRLPWL